MEVPIPVAFADAQHWGLGHWAMPILEVVLDGVAKAVEYDMARLARNVAPGGRRPTVGFASSCYASRARTQIGGIRGSSVRSPGSA
jgi:hypothetical protein